MLPEILHKSKNIYCLYGATEYFGVRMSQKQTLLSYFSPKSRSKESQVGLRRSREADALSDSNETRQATKRQKNDEQTDEISNDKPKTSLSPEQKQLIESKRQQALDRLKQKKNEGMSGLIGESWYNKLQAEFSKNYFIKVRRLGQQKI